MICPNCGHDNLPGSEECSSCLQDLTQLDRPVAQDRVERSLMEDTVESLCPRPAVTVAPSASVGQALKLMLQDNLGALLVADEHGKVLGIFSERDLLMRVTLLPEPYLDLPVHRFMTPNPEAVMADDTLAFALHKMDVGGYRHLPVLRHGKPAGMISVRDMLRHIVRLCKES